jgi:hypothetical protein
VTRYLLGIWTMVAVLAAANAGSAAMYLSRGRGGFAAAHAAVAVGWLMLGVYVTRTGVRS